MYWIGLFCGYFCLSLLIQLSVAFYHGMRTARKKKESVTLDIIPYFFLSIVIGILLSIPHCVFLAH